MKIDYFITYNVISPSSVGTDNGSVTCDKPIMSLKDVRDIEQEIIEKIKKEMSNKYPGLKDIKDNIEVKLLNWKVLNEYK